MYREDFLGNRLTEHTVTSDCYQHVLVLIKDLLQVQPLPSENFLGLRGRVEPDRLWRDSEQFLDFWDQPIFEYFY